MLVTLGAFVAAVALGFVISIPMIGIPIRISKHLAFFPAGLGGLIGLIATGGDYLSIVLCAVGGGVGWLMCIFGAKILEKHQSGGKHP